MKQAKAKRAPNAGSWKPGTTGNPNGRPRTGLAFAEAVRTRIDPHKVLDLVERHLGDEEVPIAARLNTLLPYIHAGFVRPPTTTDVNIAQREDEPDLSHLSTEQLARAMALRDELDALASSGQQPDGVPTTIHAERAAVPTTSPALPAPLPHADSPPTASAPEAPGALQREMAGLS